MMCTHRGMRRICNRRTRLGDMEELNIKGIKALEDISKKRELFFRRSSAYTQNLGKRFKHFKCFN